jgi:hypothetical protein
MSGVATKLSIINEAQDRASAVMKTVRENVAQTGAQAKKTSEELEKLDSIDRGRMAQVRAAREARQKAMAVDATRIEKLERGFASATAQSTAKIEEKASAVSGLKDRIDAAAKAQGFLNKAVGVFAFAGIIASGVAALSELIETSNRYRQSLDAVAKSQERVKQLLAELKKFNDEEAAKRMSERDRARVEELKRLEAVQDNYAELTGKVLEIEIAIGEVQKKRLEAEQKLASGMVRSVAEGLARQGAAASLLRLEQELAKLTSDKREAEKALAAAARDHGRAQYELTDTYALQVRTVDRLKGAVSGVASAWREMRWFVEDASTSVEKLETHFKEGFGDIAKKWKKDAEDKRKRAGEDAARAKRSASEREVEDVRRMRDDIARRRIVVETESAAVAKMKTLSLERDLIEREFQERRISAQQRILRLQMLDLDQAALYNELRKQGIEQLKAEEKTRDEIAKKRADDAKRARLADKKGADERNKAAIDERVKQIEALGDAATRADAPLAALSDRLEGLGSTIQETAQMWAAYAAGQKNLGAAISGTLGAIGSQVAQAISDRKAQAIVEGLFQSASAIAAYATGNIPAGIGHTAAAAAFFGLAGAGGGKSSAPSGANNAASSSNDNRMRGPASGGGGRSGPAQVVTNIIQYGNGVVYGMGHEVAKAGAQANDSLRGSGMYRRRY